jgi:hypothetical protein
VPEAELVDLPEQNAADVSSQLGRRPRLVRDGGSPATTGIDGYGLPLGAGGHCVRFNGRVFEAVVSRLEHRRVISTIPRLRCACRRDEMTPVPDSNELGVASSLAVR